MSRSRPLPETLQQAVKYFSDPQVCVDYVASLRWPDGPTCPRCEGKDHYYLKTRYLWKCKACSKQFSVKVGTIFEDSPIPLEKWLLAVWEIANDKNGISSYELAAKIGVTQKTAWFMNHRIRLAMQAGTFEKYSEKLDGAVEVDETYIGGKARNMHLSKKKERNVAKRGLGGKIAVVGFKQRDGKVVTTVVDGIRKPELRAAVRKHLKPGATLITDDLKSYRGLDAHYQHQIINHAEKYVDGQVHTNGIENFWSLLKRGLGGTYISVRPFHLYRYLDEQVYRYNHRDLSNPERVMEVLQRIAGKRVTYKELTGKTLPRQSPKPIPPRRLRAFPMGPF